MYLTNKVFVSISTIILSIFVASSFGSTAIKTQIWNGENAKPGQFPYLISLQAQTNTSLWHRCGGAILSNRFILTAAHCIDRRIPLNNCVFVGGSESMESDSGEKYEIEAFFPHKSYRRDEIGNDIGLVQLRTSIKFSSLVQPIDLGYEFIGENVLAVAAGWGQTEDYKQKNLKYLYLNTLTNEDCRQRFLAANVTNPPVNDSTLCAYSGKDDRGMCIGDSGAPLVHDNKVVGIQSWVYKEKHCAEGFPDGFERVSKHIDWINETMSSAAKKNKNKSY